MPGVLALLPEYAGLADPVADLRAACLAAVDWLGPDVRVVADEQGARVAAYLRGEVSTGSTTGAESVLVVGNGSARRTEKAPGHLDERALAFDADLRSRLSADPDSLSALDRDLARQLWADVDSLVWLGEEVRLDPRSLVVDYDDDPFGVQYWVMRWEGEWR